MYLRLGVRLRPIMAWCARLGGIVVFLFWSCLDGLFLVSLEDSARNALECHAHAGHESGIVAWAIGGDESGEESCGHVEGLEVVFGAWLLGIAEDVCENGHHG